LELLFSHLKQLPASSSSSASFGPPSLLDKPSVLRTLRSYQSSNLCTYFTMALGLLSLILLALFASGQYENSPVLYKNAPVMAAAPNNTLSLLQSDSVVSSMRAISPVFNSWATATQNVSGGVADGAPGGSGGGGAGSNTDLLNKTSVTIIIEKCVEATVVAKALGDWLLASQGLLAVYHAGEDLHALDDSANSTCQSLGESDVGFAHMKDLVCSPLNWRQYGSDHIGKYELCREPAGRTDFTLASCMSMLTDLHVSNLTATVLLGLTLPDLPASSQYSVAQNASGGADSRWLVTQYLNISRPWVQVVEMSAFNYYLQSAALTSACTTFSVINSMSLDFNKPPRSAAGQPQGPRGYDAQQQGGSPRVIHPMILFVLLLGSTGLFLIMQMLLSGFVAGSLNVYRKIKRL
jgi:hypothetical protein